MGGTRMCSVAVLYYVVLHCAVLCCAVVLSCRVCSAVSPQQQQHITSRSIYNPQPTSPHVRTPTSQAGRQAGRQTDRQRAALYPHTGAWAWTCAVSGRDRVSRCAVVME